MKRRYLLLLGATPVVIFLVFIALALTEQSDFTGDGYPGWEAVEELAEKYDLTIGTQNAFGPSHCSTAYRIYTEAARKDKNINTYKDIKSAPIFGRVRAWAYPACYSQYRHRDWTFWHFG